jgi:chorismate mutase
MNKAMNEADNAHLAGARQEIDKIDMSIWSLLEKRFALSKEVARIKNNFQLPVLDEKREKDVLTKIDNLSCDGEVSSAINKIYKLIFELSRKYQSE